MPPFDSSDCLGSELDHVHGTPICHRHFEPRPNLGVKFMILEGNDKKVGATTIFTSNLTSSRGDLGFGCSRFSGSDLSRSCASYRFIMTGLSQTFGVNFRPDSLWISAARSPLLIARIVNQALHCPTRLCRLDAEKNDKCKVRGVYLTSVPNDSLIVCI